MNKARGGILKTARTKLSLEIRGLEVVETDRRYYISGELNFARFNLPHPGIFQTVLHFVLHVELGTVS